MKLVLINKENRAVGIFCLNLRKHLVTDFFSNKSFLIILTNRE